MERGKETLISGIRMSGIVWYPGAQVTSQRSRRFRHVTRVVLKGVSGESGRDGGRIRVGSGPGQEVRDQQLERNRTKREFSFRSVLSEVTVGRFLQNCNYSFRPKVDFQLSFDDPFPRKKQGSRNIDRL
uniref:Uncharacterized protein n=1 Tax=Romanomermis culicivorax TaxID=13658 RepID=A0A915INR4_ROMCU